jgi:hypothetical protein
MEIEDREAGRREGLGVVEWSGGREVETTEKRVRDQRQKGRIKGEEDVRCSSSQIRELSAELIVDAGVCMACRE